MLFEVSFVAISAAKILFWCDSYLYNLIFKPKVLGKGIKFKGVESFEKEDIKRRGRAHKASGKGYKF